MFIVDLSLPFAAVLVLAAGFAGWYTRGHENRGQFDTYVDRSAPELQSFERRNQRLSR